MKPAALLLSALGLGLLRPAPGTWGSLPPPVMVLALLWLLGPHWTIDASLILLALAASIVCVRFGGLAEQALGRKDPGQVVADEVAGQSLALLFLPWRGLAAPGFPWHDLTIAAAAFLAFRILDIVKPPPARQAQAIRGGWGILADDLIAGAYACLLVQVVTRVAMASLGGR